MSMNGKRAVPCYDHDSSWHVCEEMTEKKWKKDREVET